MGSAPVTQMGRKHFAIGYFGAFRHVTSIIITTSHLQTLLHFVATIPLFRVIALESQNTSTNIDFPKPFSYDLRSTNFMRRSLQHVNMPVVRQVRPMMEHGLDRLDGGGNC